MQEGIHMSTELGKRAFIPKSNKSNLSTTLVDRHVTKDTACMGELALLIVEDGPDVYVLRCTVGTYVNTNPERGNTNKPMVGTINKE